MSLKATSISDLILSKAIVSSRGHRLAVELRSPSSSSPCSAALNPSETETATSPPAVPVTLWGVFSIGFSGKVEISSISFTELQLRHTNYVVGWRQKKINGGQIGKIKG